MARRKPSAAAIAGKYDSKTALMALAKATKQRKEQAMAKSIKIGISHDREAGFRNPDKWVRDSRGRFA